ncbi:similar to An16g03230 [Aspergillus luchuensis]|uniref:Similar to An16g03230 n=1 Tax=Aspergillus kawachii TaxID=1069201 RepID=A0A146FGN4_ASPKA|nr:similar to An16g03230 [Aspergillus luchuensis]
MSSDSSHTMECEEPDECTQPTEPNKPIELNKIIQSIEPIWPIIPLNLKRYFPTTKSESYEFEPFEASPNPEKESYSDDEQLFQAQKLYFRDHTNRRTRYLCLIIIYGHSSHEEACKEALRLSWHRNRKKMSSKVIMGLIIDEEKQAWFRGSHTDERYIKKMGRNWVANNECMLRRYFRTFRRGLRRHAPSPGYDPGFDSGSESELDLVEQDFLGEGDVDESFVSDAVSSDCGGEGVDDAVRPGSSGSGHDGLSDGTDSGDELYVPDMAEDDSSRFMNQPLAQTDSDDDNDSDEPEVDPDSFDYE